MISSVPKRYCAVWDNSRVFLALPQCSWGSSTAVSNEKGQARSPAPCYFVFWSGSLQRDPAAAAKAGFPTFTLICFGFASSRFGMLSISTPF
jgi:hypothetical protein